MQGFRALGKDFDTPYLFINQSVHLISLDSLHSMQLGNEVHDTYASPFNAWQAACRAEERVLR